MKKILCTMKTTLVRHALITAALAAGFVATQNRAVAQAFGGFGGNNANRTSSRSASTASYPSSTQMGTATVSVDPETRRVFVVTDEETADYVKQVVQDLDRPTPQVLIKCVFLEATYTKDSDVGVEGNYKHTISGSSIKELNGNGTASTLGALGALGTAGPFYSLAGQDLNVTLSALAKAGKTEILSRPSILARNNQAATISLGQQVPLITATRFDTFGNQINTVTYQNVGIILSVTPFITSDSMVEMVVTPQTSELADRSQWVPISGGGTNSASSISAPVINSRSADTVVVVPDGQTVVIGGLMQNKKLNSESKVPLLGDIPVLGMLFKHKVTSNGKTELMIFMTPHVVQKPGDLAAITTTERSAQDITKKAFTEQDLNRYLDNLPSVDNSKSDKK